MKRSTLVVLLTGALLAAGFFIFGPCLQSCRQDREWTDYRELALHGQRIRGRIVNVDDGVSDTLAGVQPRENWSKTVTVEYPGPDGKPERVEELWPALEGETFRKGDAVEVLYLPGNKIVKAVSANLPAVRRLLARDKH